MPSIAWLWPDGLSLSDFVDAILIAVFLYWGWDTAVAVNEEADDPAKTPGRAAVLSTVLLLVTYVLVAVASVAFAGTGTTGIGLGNPDNANDMFAAVGPAVFGDGPIGSVFVILLIISVLTSSAASTQTTILPTARAALSMGAYRAIPPRFAKIHPRYLTPSYATWGMGIASILFYVLLTIDQHERARRLDLGSGLLIAFYYGLTGFACVWYYRKHLHGRNLWTKGVLPGLGGLLLLGAFVDAADNYAQPDGGETTVFGIGGVFVIGIGVAGARRGADAHLQPDRAAVLPRRDPHEGQPRPGPGAPPRRGDRPAGLPRGDGDRPRPLQPAARPAPDGPARVAVARTGSGAHTSQGVRGPDPVCTSYTAMTVGHDHRPAAVGLADPPADHPAHRLRDAVGVGDALRLGARRAPSSTSGSTASSALGSSEKPRPEIVGRDTARPVVASTATRDRDEAALAEHQPVATAWTRRRRRPARPST